jgi:ribonucleotide reductase beta subunit family protein with ferritin-like domain
MQLHIEFTIDKLLNRLGLQKHFKTATPFTWAEDICKQAEKEKKLQAVVTRTVVSSKDKGAFTTDAEF